MKVNQVVKVSDSNVMTSFLIQGLGRLEPTYIDFFVLLFLVLDAHSVSFSDLFVVCFGDPLQNPRK